MPKLQPWFLNRSDLDPDIFLKGNAQNISLMYDLFTKQVPADNYNSLDEYREAAAVFIAIAIDRNLQSITEAISCDNYDEDLVLKLTTILYLEFTTNYLISEGLIDKI